MEYMKIIVTARTFNEPIEDILRFCKCYQWADLILLGDGYGRNDFQDVLSFGNVKIDKFLRKVNLKNGFYNPRGKHTNFLINWAHKEKADWIIFDDVDCVPSNDLQKQGRNIIESQISDMIFAYRMFILGQDEWFPRMNDAGQSLWAWNSRINVRADEKSKTLSIKIPEGKKKLMLNHPYALLHYFYPDEESFNRKKSQYVQTGEAGLEYNPKDQFGPIEKLPGWAVWRN